MDLSTSYLGFRLPSPVVASASPLTGDVAVLEQLEEAGAGAVVLPSLFEEQIEHVAFELEMAYDTGRDVFAEATSYLPDLDSVDAGPNRHLALVEQARDRVSIPVIASINGVTPGGWVRYARFLADAGADAIELNLYDVVVDPRTSAGDVERRYVELVEEVAAEITVPLAVKIGPWFTALAQFASALAGAGADALVLFNRLYQPDIDLDTLDVTPQLQLSSPSEARLPLHWIGILRGTVGCSLAASSGVHGAPQVLKLLLAGADATMMTSAILRHGPEHVRRTLHAVREWMTERGYESVEQMKGSVSRRNALDAGAYERGNYFQVLHSWTGPTRALLR